MRLVNGKKIWSAMWEYRHPDVDCFTSQVCLVSNIWYFSSIKCLPQVKPKLTQVRDISKKINKDTGDDAGIFMGDCKYHFLSILEHFFLNTHVNTQWKSLNYNEPFEEIYSMKHRCKTDMNLQLTANRFYTQKIIFVCIGCLASSGPPSPSKDKPKAVPKTKPETKKKWLKLTRKGLLLSSICKVGKQA